MLMSTAHHLHAFPQRVKVVILPEEPGRGPKFFSITAAHDARSVIAALRDGVGPGELNDEPGNTITADPRNILQPEPAVYTYTVSQHHAGHDPAAQKTAFDKEHHMQRAMLASL